MLKLAIRFESILQFNWLINNLSANKVFKLIKKSVHNIIIIKFAIKFKNLFLN
jgi:hypothetical protein